MTTTFASDNADVLKIGWFTTGRGEGSYGLLESTLNAIDSGELRGKITFVFVNRVKGQTDPTDRFLTLVRSHGIPLITYLHAISASHIIMNRGPIYVRFSIKL